MYECVKAIDYLKSLPRNWLPKNLEHGIKAPSNGALIRWLKNKAIIINGKTPMPQDEIDFPITELVFFPASKKRKTTLVKECASA